MAFKKIKENSSFNSDSKFFLIEEDADLQEIEQLYSCEQGDIAELPTGAQYIRNSIGEWILQPLSDDGGSGGSSISGTINISSNGIKSVAGYSQANVNVQPQVSLQNKTVTPTTSNQSISADNGYTGLGTVMVQGDNNLIASNIKKDVQIFGTTGNYEGENTYLSEAPANDVEFIDYNGDRLYSYSKVEFLALEEMPQNPTHEGLTAQGWNWTLSDAKTCVNEYDKLVIGQNYITSDGKTRIYVFIPEDRLDIDLCFHGIGNYFRIDWGDDTYTVITPTYSNVDLSYRKSHTYSTSKLYEITITVPNSCSLSFYGDGDLGERYASNLIVVQGGYSDYQNIAVNYGQYQNIKKIYLGQNITLEEGAFSSCKDLEEITIPQYIQTCPGFCFYNCKKIKAVVLPNGTTTLSYYAFQNSALKRISLPKTISTLESSTFYLTRNIEKVCIPYVQDIPENSFYQSGISCVVLSNDLTQIKSSCFYECENLEYLNIPTSLTTIKSNALYFTKLTKIILPSSIMELNYRSLGYTKSLKSIVFLGSTPPTFNSSDWTVYSGTINNWGDGKLYDLVIYVPQNSLEIYNNTTNFRKSSNPTYYTVEGY